MRVVERRQPLAGWLAFNLHLLIHPFTTASCRSIRSRTTNVSRQCTPHQPATLTPIAAFLSAVIDAQEAKIRSDWVNTMEARLVREELAKCWREEGVNHYQSCHALAEKYLDMVRTHRVRPTIILALCRDERALLRHASYSRSLATESSISHHNIPSDSPTRPPSSPSMALTHTDVLVISGSEGGARQEQL